MRDTAGLYDAFLGGGGEPVAAFVDGLGVGGRWLDAGCGTGRLLPLLSGIGLQVEGLEPRADYAARARRRAPGTVVHDGDLASLSAHPPGRFDGVLICNGPLAYILDDEGLGRALAGVFRALRPGGVLVSDTPNFEWILDNYRAPASQRAWVDGALVERRPRHGIDRDARIFAHTDTLVRLDGEPPVEVDRVEERYEFAIRSADSVVDAHRSAGFGGLASWRGWTAREPGGEPGPRILLTGHRPGSTAEARPR